jgi:hypothetical protein
MHMKVPSTTILSFPTHSPLLTAGKNIVAYFWTDHVLFSEYFRYKIFINGKGSENESNKFQENLSHPGIIDAEAQYWAAAQKFETRS